MNKPQNLFLIILSFVSIYIIWGSTYLFSAYAIKELPAFRLCAYRYTISGLIILITLSVKGIKIMPSKKEIANACIAGIIFLGLGTGGAIWALNFIDTGLTALIIAGEPLLIVFLIWIIKKRRPLRQTLVGVLLSLFGMLLLVSQDVLISGHDQWVGVLIIFLSMVAWGLGSIFANSASLPSSSFLNSGIQMVIGGIVTFAISKIIGEADVAIFKVNHLTFYSLAYLILFGSIIAFTAFNYLLKNVATEKVVTNTYINPIIAMILGYVFLDERITHQSIIAAVIMISGVFIINTSRFKSSKKVN